MTSIQERHAPLHDRVAVAADQASDDFAAAAGRIKSAVTSIGEAIGRNRPATSAEELAFTQSLVEIATAYGAYQRAALLVDPPREPVTVDLGIMGQASLGLVPDIQPEPHWDSAHTQYGDVVNVGDLVKHGGPEWCEVVEIIPPHESTAPVAAEIGLRLSDGRIVRVAPTSMVQHRPLLRQPGSMSEVRD